MTRSIDSLTFQGLLRQLYLPRRRGTILPCLSLKDLKALSQTSAEVHRYVSLFLRGKRNEYDLRRPFLGINFPSLLIDVEKIARPLPSGIYTIEHPPFKTLIHRNAHKTKYYLFYGGRDAVREKGSCKLIEFPLDLTTQKIVAFSNMMPGEAEKEVRILTMLKKCPHVSQPLDHFLWEDQAVLVFPYFEVSDIDSIILDPGFTSFHQSRVSIQLSEAIWQLHNKEIVHSDIKKENIALTCNEDQLSVRLFDFGNSGHNGELFIGGTPSSNMCPTVCKSLSLQRDVILSPAHDFYGLGVFFYFLFSRTSPSFDEPLPPISNINIELACMNRAFSKTNSYKFIFNKFPKYHPLYPLFYQMINREVAKRPSIKQVITVLKENAHQSLISQTLTKSNLVISQNIKTRNIFSEILNFIRTKGKGNIVACLSDHDLSSLTHVAQFSMVFSQPFMHRRYALKMMRSTTEEIFRFMSTQPKGVEFRRYYPYETPFNMSFLWTPSTVIPFFHEVACHVEESRGHFVTYDRRKDCLALATSQSFFSLQQGSMNFALENCPYTLVSSEVITGLSEEAVIFSEYTLQNYIQAKSRIKNLYQKILLMSQMAEALSFMHKKGIVYLDCNLRHCFLSATTDSPEVRLFLHSHVSPISQFFDPNCDVSAPPEVVKALDQRLTPRLNPSMDSWSLGMAFVYMLKGTYPSFYVAKGDYRNYFKIVTKTVIIQELREASSCLPLNNLLTQMMSIDPSERPHMSTVAARLKSILAGMTR